LDECRALRTKRLEPAAVRHLEGAIDLGEDIAGEPQKAREAEVDARVT
jgi:hypothetical protein